MGKCAKCGGKAPFMTLKVTGSTVESLCDECVWGPDESAAAKTTKAAPSPDRTNVASSDSSSVSDANGGHVAACMVIGILLWVIAAYLLLLSPGLGDEVLGREIVNLQKLFLGTTCGISGAVFISAAIRPR